MRAAIRAGRFAAFVDDFRATYHDDRPQDQRPGRDADPDRVERPAEISE